jgi:hypothetical protein
MQRKKITEDYNITADVLERLGENRLKIMTVLVNSTPHEWVLAKGFLYVTIIVLPKEN